MTMPINRDLITDQMNALGISERSLVQRTAFPHYQLRKARQTGAIDGHVTTAQILRLASQLGTTVAELLTVETEDPSPPSADLTTGDDVETLIPLLVGLPRLVTINHLARTLAWDRQRLDRTLEEIPQALLGTGLVLSVVNDAVKITSGKPTSKPLRHALGRLRTTLAGLNSAEASTLKRITDGEKVLKRNIGNQERLVLGSLKNLACIELGDDATYRPSPALTLALPDLG